MKYFIMDENIDGLTLKKFYDFVSENKEPYTMILKSDGGVRNIARFIIDNINKDELCIEIIVNGYISSCAVYFMTDIENKPKRVLENTVVLMHHGAWSVENTRDAKLVKKAYRTIDTLQEKEFFDMVNGIFTEKIIDEYLRGEDIMFILPPGTYQTREQFLLSLISV